MRCHLVLLAPLSLIACSDDGGGPAEPTVGILEISTATTGTAPDPDGYTVSFDGSAARSLGVNASLAIADIVPGVHSVALSGLSTTCAVAGDNPRTVTISAGVTAQVTFSIHCLATGSRIAFASDRDGENEAADIYAMNADGSNLIRLTNHPASDDEPAWSPDGSKIAFVSSRDDLTGIFVMNADGSGVVRLTRDYGEEPAWAPDGSKIAFVGFPDGNSEIFVMDADGSDVIQLTLDPAVNESPAWSPDGGKIAVTRDGAIYLVDADGSNVNPLLLEGECCTFKPAWSPDGSRIAFQAYVEGDPGIFVMDADGSNVTRLTSDPDDAPAWSPDGSKIAFDRQSEPFGEPDIYVMNADGSNVTRLTDHPTVEDEDPTWSP